MRSEVQDKGQMAIEDLLGKNFHCRQELYQELNILIVRGQGPSTQRVCP